MDHTDQPALNYAIDLWKRWMTNDLSEVRALWFPSESPCLVGGWSRSDGAWEDLEDQVENRIVIVVNTAVHDMPPAMRAAFEASIGLLKVCKVRDAESQSLLARGRVWRALLSEGVA